jgi:hypothetical protein
MEFELIERPPEPQERYLERDRPYPRRGGLAPVPVPPFRPDLFDRALAIPEQEAGS